jgi:hypothetical protein
VNGLVEGLIPKQDRGAARLTDREIWGEWDHWDVRSD